MAKPEQLVNARAPQVPVPSLDSLQSFTAATALPLLRFPLKGQEEQVLGDEGLELSLGLSLNGRFGVNPGSSKLTRSASISYVKSSLGGGFDYGGSNGLESGMARTCSLLVENKGESGGDKKRKDVLTWRRLEARRRKIEKLRDAVPCEMSNNSGVSIRNGLIGSCLNGYDKIGVTGKSTTQQEQLVSMQSRRSGSLRTECREIQVSAVNNDTPGRSITSVTPPQGKEHNTPGVSQERPRLATNPRERSTTSVSEKSCNGIVDDANEEGKRMLKTVFENMPCVSAKGDGPNGKKVEGFLYRYRKGEEVRIVCVCHGSFFTPVEFVKHAGGCDVAYPLKHIVVNTSSTL